MEFVPPPGDTRTLSRAVGQKAAHGRALLPPEYAGATATTGQQTAATETPRRRGGRGQCPPMCVAESHPKGRAMVGAVSETRRITRLVRRAGGGGDTQVTVRSFILVVAGATFRGKTLKI